MALSLVSVSRRYGRTVALAPVTLRLGRGTVCVVHGPNGSGKTTLLRLAAGLLSPTTGQRHARGGAVVYARPGDGLRAAQTPRQAVAFAAGLGDIGVAVPEALAAAGLSGIADAPAWGLSAGQLARVTLAVVLACRPAVACLDEPTLHLDTDGRALVESVVDRLVCGGAAVLVATHERDLLSGVADARLRLECGRAKAWPW